ncbi:MAG: ketoacyl-ACP synthase III [Streptococcaceae bacterium]|jgi:3-oxoacyl-[acyl-carrier-protein] synthase-3|nr:ketoacyl-ACP synthase III [Streptococcaceae bacterium]
MVRSDRRFARITAVSHATPARIVTNDDLSALMDTSDEWIRSRTGICARRLAADDVKTSDLALEVAEKLLAKSGLSADKLDFILVATITPDSQMPSTAARVQTKIGATNAFAYDLSAACSGFVFALATADKFIASGAYRCGIVIGAETLSKVIDWSDRSTAVLFGDGAGGVLLEASADMPFVQAEKLRTDGSRADSLTAGPDKLQMDGRAIFDFAVRDVPKNISETLTLGQLTADNIDYFVLHQANSRILDKMAQKLHTSREKFPQNMDRYGNTSAASIPLLLSELTETGTLKLDGSQTVLLCGFGGGLTWGSLIITL